MGARERFLPFSRLDLAQCDGSGRAAGALQVGLANREEAGHCRW
jgi:hypothetical protein